MAELDHDAIKSQIVTLLQANASLYTTTAEEGEFRSIEVGFPDTFNYDIVMVVNEKDSRTAEELLDDLQKILMETLEADYNLNSTVDESYFIRVDELRTPGGELGKGFKGRVITLRCSKVTA